MSMASIFKQVFSERNLIITSSTNLLYQAFNQLWRLWWSLYLVEIGAPIPIVGLLAMVQETSMILFQLPGGMLADRFGRKKVIMFGTGLRVAAPLIMVLGRTWQQVAPGIILNAVSGLYLPALNAIIAESIPFDRRGAAYGAYRAITNSPQIFMPVISGIYISRLGIVNGVRMGLILYEFAAITAFVTRSIFLRETLIKNNIQEAESEKYSSREILSALRKSLTRSSTLLVMLLVATVSSFSMRMVTPFLAIYAVNVIGLDTIQWGLLQSIFSVISIPLFLLGGIISDRIGRVPAIILARSLIPTEYLGLLITQNFTHLMFLFLLLGIGGGLGGGTIRGGGYMGGPSWQALIADIVPSENRGKVLGLMATIAGLISMPASVLGGYVWEKLSSNMLLTIGSILGASIVPIMVLYLKDPKIRER